MCGIFGYSGKQDAAPHLIRGIKTLEYRGYDSAGVYVHGNTPIKAVGEVKKNVQGTEYTYYTILYNNKYYFVAKNNYMLYQEQ